MNESTINTTEWSVGDRCTFGTGADEWVIDSIEWDEAWCYRIHRQPTLNNEVWVKLSHLVPWPGANA